MEKHVTLKARYDLYIMTLEKAWESIQDVVLYGSKIDFGITVEKKFPEIKDWLFKKYYNRELTAKEYVESLSTNKLLKSLK